jgi:hypothetical protein
LRDQQGPSPTRPGCFNALFDSALLRQARADIVCLVGAAFVPVVRVPLCGTSLVHLDQQMVYRGCFSQLARGNFSGVWLDGPFKFQHLC